MFDFLVPNMTDDDVFDGWGVSANLKFLYPVICRPPLTENLYCFSIFKLIFYTFILIFQYNLSIWNESYICETFRTKQVRTTVNLGRYLAKFDFLVRDDFAYRPRHLLAQRKTFLDVCGYLDKKKNQIHFRTWEYMLYRVNWRLFKNVNQRILAKTWAKSILGHNNRQNYHPWGLFVQEKVFIMRYIILVKIDVFEFINIENTKN